jgi:phage protein D
MAEDANKHLTPVWIVYVDGKRLDTDHEGALQKIHVDDIVDGIGFCTLVFDSSAVKIAETGTFSLESEVSVHLGYKDDCDQVFVGEVTDFDIQCNEYGNEQTIITCRNCLYKLENAHKAVSFESKNISDALKELIDSYSIKSDIDTFGPTKTYFSEIHTNDLKFILQNAKNYGKTVYAYDSTIYIKDEVTVANDDIIMEWGKSLISFKGHEQLRNQCSECTFVGWDELNCEAITGTASLSEISLKVGGNSSWEDNSKGADGKWNSTYLADDLFDNDDAKNRAIGKLTNSSFDYQTGVAKGEGNYKVHPGMRLNIKYVGKKFSGEYIASRVEHDISIGGAFTTTVYVKRNMKE